MKDNVESLNTGALQLETSFKDHLSEVEPWTTIINTFTNSVCVLTFIFMFTICALLIAQNIPRFAYVKKYNFLIWISTMICLTGICMSSHF